MPTAGPLRSEHLHSGERSLEILVELRKGVPSGVLADGAKVVVRLRAVMHASASSVGTRTNENGW